jgi:hypothetical protein
MASVSVLTNFGNGTAVRSPVRPVVLIDNPEELKKVQNHHQLHGSQSPKSSSGGFQKFKNAKTPHQQENNGSSSSEPTFEFYTFNNFGQLIKQFLTLSEIEAKVKNKDKNGDDLRVDYVELGHQT